MVEAVYWAHNLLSRHAVEQASGWEEVWSGETGRYDVAGTGRVRDGRAVPGLQIEQA